MIHEKNEVYYKKMKISAISQVNKDKILILFRYEKFISFVSRKTKRVISNILFPSFSSMNSVILWRIKGLYKLP